ncbi:MAG TPA: VOC family protein [Candidatus Acidoferrales bacterium]|nr:VOC family protein [Candidatus Acidoferrales bacterium]
MPWIVSLFVAAAMAAAGSHAGPRPAEEKKPMVKKLTPVLFVAEIEPCVKFWTEQLGFQKTVEVPEGNKLGFVILVKGSVELMYQSYASVDKDWPATGQAARKGPTFLYIEVEDLEAVKAAVKGAEVVMPERTTFYGAREIGIKDPAGHYLTFAQFAPAPGN